MEPDSALAGWTALDPGGPPTVTWARPASGSRIAVLPGAFDPPTNAHLDIIAAVASDEGSAPVLCLTKVVLARPADRLLSEPIRIRVLLDIAERLQMGLAFVNRATYLEVGRTFSRAGFEATFAVGADKLEQLADPSFYPNGSSGVDATFDELRFVVVPRNAIDAGSSHRARDVRVLDPRDVFSDARTAAISGTEVRRLLRSGRKITGLVPPEVVLALRGYTSAR